MRCARFEDGVRLRGDLHRQQPMGTQAQLPGSE